jgi:hypothetical protein
MGRHARPTLRTLRDDLKVSVPWDEPFVDLDVPLIREVERVAPHSPLGQKRIIGIEDTMIYRVRTSDWRGATWLESAEDIIWLVAAGPRRDGDREDFYNHVSALHERKRLLPDDDDRRKWRAEEGLRWVDQLSSDLTLLVNQTRLLAGQEHTGVLCGDIEATVLRTNSGQPAEWWLGLRFESLPDWLPERQATEIISALAAEMVGASDWELRNAWAYPKPGAWLVIWLGREAYPPIPPR